MAKENIKIGKHEIKVNKIKKHKKKDRGNKMILEIKGDRQYIFDIGKSHPLYAQFIKEYDDNVKDKPPKDPKPPKVKKEKKARKK